MHADNADVRIVAGTLGTAWEIGLHLTNAKRRQVKPPTATHPIGLLGQTGRRLTDHDWNFLKKIPYARGVDGEARMQAWCIYEYARESETIRTWASILVKVGRMKVSLNERKERYRIVDQLRDAFPGPRDGWIPTLIVSMARHLAIDRAWMDIDETERNEGVDEAINTFEGLHQVGGNVGDVRKREIGVRLTRRGDERESAWAREEQFQSLSLLKARRRRGKPTEVFRFEIEWKGTRDAELKAAFAALLLELRPNNYPELPSLSHKIKSRIKPTAFCIALADLGMMRLRHTFSSSHIIDLTNKELATQSDMGKRARNNFRQLFPFLPPMELARAEQLLLKRAT